MRWSSEMTHWKHVIYWNGEIYHWISAAFNDTSIYFSDKSSAAGFRQQLMMSGTLEISLTFNCELVFLIQIITESSTRNCYLYSHDSSSPMISGQRNFGSGYPLSIKWFDQLDGPETEKSFWRELKTSIGWLSSREITFTDLNSASK